MPLWKTTFNKMLDFVHTILRQNGHSDDLPKTGRAVMGTPRQSLSRVNNTL